MDADSIVLRGRLVTPDEVVERGWVALGAGAVVDLGDGPGPAGRPEVDLGELIVAPGLVDLHVHGGGGGQAGGAGAAEVRAGVVRLARYHATHGTTCLLAATVADTPVRLAVAVAGIASAMATADPGAAAVAGAHLEGPWLAPSRRGAHAPECLRPPDPDELARLLGAAPGVVRLLTAAPELDGFAGLLATAVAGGVVVSVGHTDATYEQVVAAFDAGARHVTHLGNAMPPLDRRRPGPLAAALGDPRPTLEVIADGEHVHPGLLALVGAVAPDRLVAVTDAVAATGLADGVHRLGGLEVTVRDGRVSLRDDPGTLAGSVLTMDRAVANLVGAGLPLTVALRAATATPAGVLGAGRDGRVRGVLRAGAAADVVVLDEGLAAVATVVAGRVVHDPGALLAGVGGAAGPPAGRRPSGTGPPGPVGPAGPRPDAPGPA